MSNSTSGYTFQMKALQSSKRLHLTYSVLVWFLFIKFYFEGLLDIKVDLITQMKLNIPSKYDTSGRPFKGFDFLSNVPPLGQMFNVCLPGSHAEVTHSPLTAYWCYPLCPHIWLPTFIFPQNGRTDSCHWNTVWNSRFPFPDLNTWKKPAVLQILCLGKRAQTAGSLQACDHVCDSKPGKHMSCAIMLVHLCPKSDGVLFSLLSLVRHWHQKAFYQRALQA